MPLLPGAPPDQPLRSRSAEADSGLGETRPVSQILRAFERGFSTGLSAVNAKAGRAKQPKDRPANTLRAVQRIKSLRPAAALQPQVERANYLSLLAQGTLFNDFDYDLINLRDGARGPRNQSMAIFVLNTAVALLLGMAIGLERHFRHHPAGLRTNALVCLGAALFVSLSLMVGNDSPTRIAAQVVSGIGFLGGGVILREGLNVRGMNTAATLWCSAAIGTLAGLGLLAQAAIGTAAILITHIALRPLIRILDTRLPTAADVETLYRVRVVCLNEHEGPIRAIFMRHINSQQHMTLQRLSTQDTDQPDRTAVIAEIFATVRNDRYMNDLVSRISIEPSISAVSWEKIQGEAPL
jgi:putative Mg2+ transporter-C (MgtC) family protein